jgi:aconitase B
MTTLNESLQTTCELARRNAETVIETLNKVAASYVFQDHVRARRAYDAAGRVAARTQLLDAVLCMGIQERTAQALSDLLHTTRQADAFLSFVSSYDQEEI